MEAQKRPRILIADDDPQTVELLEAFLSVEFDVLKAYDGEEALDVSRKDLPDLILLDVIMPKLNGYEVCKRLKKSEETRFIPVVMITALKDLEERIKGIVVGSDDFLTKPIRKIELLARVRSLLKFKTLAKEEIHGLKGVAREGELGESSAILQTLEGPLKNVMAELEILEASLGGLTDKQKAHLQKAIEGCQEILRRISFYIK
ncbi:MAG: response regulator [candidate division NC10 bacterium]|nr:response regulator [candidate division NC10 bacterium]